MNLKEKFLLLAIVFLLGVCLFKVIGPRSKEINLPRHTRENVKRPEAQALIILSSDKKVQQVALVKKEKKDKKYLVAPKLKLDLAFMFAKSSLFRKANPGLDLAKVLSGEVPLSAVILPRNMRMSIEREPSCTGPGSTVNNSIDELKVQDPKARSALFVQVPHGNEENLQTFSDRLVSDPCIKEVRYDWMDGGAMADSNGDKPAGSRTPAAVDPAEVAMVDQKVAEINSQQAIPTKFGIVGTRGDLAAMDPTLQPSGSRLSGGEYAYGNDTSTTGAYVNRRIYPIRDASSFGTSDPDAPAGAVSYVSMNNAINAAVKTGANVVDITVPFDPTDYPTAMQNVQTSGIVVVTSVPIPKAGGPPRGIPVPRPTASTK